MASDSLGLVYRNGTNILKIHLGVNPTLHVMRRETLFSGQYDDYDIAPNGTFVALRPAALDAQIVIVRSWVAELAHAGKR